MLLFFQPKIGEALYFRSYLVLRYQGNIHFVCRNIIHETFESIAAWYIYKEFVSRSNFNYNQL